MKDVPQGSILRPSLFNIFIKTSFESFLRKRKCKLRSLRNWERPFEKWQHEQLCIGIRITKTISTHLSWHKTLTTQMSFRKLKIFRYLQAFTTFKINIDLLIVNDNQRIWDFYVLHRKTASLKSVNWSITDDCEILQTVVTLI